MISSPQFIYYLVHYVASQRSLLSRFYYTSYHCIIKNWTFHFHSNEVVRSFTRLRSLHSLHFVRFILVPLNLEIILRSFYYCWSIKTFNETIVKTHMSNCKKYTKRFHPQIWIYYSEVNVKSQLPCLSMNKTCSRMNLLGSPMNLTKHIKYFVNKFG